MDQLGHTDPKLTLRIYARAMRRDAGDNDRLRALAGEEQTSKTFDKLLASRASPGLH